MTYYIAANSTRKATYHGDTDCHQLCQTDNVREATEHHLEELAACKVCLPEERGETPDRNGGGEWVSFTNTLRANPEEFTE